MGQCYGFFEIPSVTAAIDAVDIIKPQMLR